MKKALIPNVDSLEIVAACLLGSSPVDAGSSGEPANYQLSPERSLVVLKDARNLDPKLSIVNKIQEPLQKLVMDAPRKRDADPGHWRV